MKSYRLILWLKKDAGIVEKIGVEYQGMSGLIALSFRSSPSGLHRTDEYQKFFIGKTQVESFAFRPWNWKSVSGNRERRNLKQNDSVLQNNLSIFDPAGFPSSERSHSFSKPKVANEEDFFIATVVNLVKPVVMEKYEFECRDSSIMITLRHFETIMILTLGTKSNFSKSNTPPETKIFRERFGSKKTIQQL